MTQDSTRNFRRPARYFLVRSPAAAFQGIDRLAIFAVQLTLAGLRRGFCLKSDAAAPIDHPIRYAGIKRAA
jgi:hypothetical protein